MSTRRWHTTLKTAKIWKKCVKAACLILRVPPITYKTQERRCASCQRLHFNTSSITLRKTHCSDNTNWKLSSNKTTLNQQYDPEHDVTNPLKKQYIYEWVQQYDIELKILALDSNAIRFIGTTTAIASLVIVSSICHENWKLSPIRIVSHHH